jgi:hypothetical protein
MIATFSLTGVRQALPELAEIGGAPDAAPAQQPATLIQVARGG